MLSGVPNGELDDEAEPNMVGIGGPKRLVVAPPVLGGEAKLKLDEGGARGPNRLLVVSGSVALEPSPFGLKPNENAPGVVTPVGGKEKDEVVVDVKELMPIARPLAQRKLLKKLHKVIKKGTSSMVRVPLVCSCIFSLSLEATASEARRQRSGEGDQEG